jgi:hypothetical protein
LYPFLRTHFKGAPELHPKSEYNARLFAKPGLGSRATPRYLWVTSEIKKLNIPSLEQMTGKIQVV